MVFSIFNFTNRTLFTSVNATYVEGPITQDTVWTLVDSPFVVSNDIRVNPGVTLTVEPGVEVKFGGNFSLIISGRLYANGMQKTITFTSNKEPPEVGDWNAIRFNGIEKSMIMGCFIAYARDGIFVENGDVEIESSTISLCRQNGINITNSELIVQNSVIAENQENGICITGNGQITIQNNTIIGNGNGILLTGNEASGVDISRNKISANKQSGIQIDANNHADITIVDNTVSSNDKGFYASSPTNTYFTNNSISYNNVGFLYDEGNHAVNYTDIYGNKMGMNVLSNAIVNAEYNYWGDPSGPYHKSLNPNGKGNPVGGNGINLDFIFFLAKPIGIINSRPTATLLTDKIWVRPNEDVMFFATNSFDNDGRVDRYFFDFGDGSNSGWTTLSIFAHKYSSPRTCYPNLTVMDDYGVVSNSVNATMYVQDLPSLHVSVDLSNSMVHEGEQVSITVYVTDGTAAVENATVTLFSVNGGDFTETSGFTNASGYFVTTFTAPDVAKKANVRIIARASKNGYTDSSDHEYLEVSPFLSVQITANPEVIKSEGTAQILIHVKSNVESVANATVTILSTGGSLSSETGITDSSGILSLVFTAPQTTTFLNVNITAVAMKNGYINGEGQTIIAVDPKTLAVQIAVDSSVTISEAKLNVTVHVEYDMIPIAEANVTIMAENGNFSVTTELTDTDGDAKFIFTAPKVNEQTNITIAAQATKARYAEGQSQLRITVNPRTFKVQITSPTVNSGESTIIEVSVTCREDAAPVAGAIVTMSSREGNFSTITQTTSSTGVCAFTFHAPETTTQLPVIVIANVTKDGYVAGGNQTTIMVNPKIAPPAEGGWSLITILLIVIPIVIVVVVLILIKLKIIVISSEEEE